MSPLRFLGPNVAVFALFFGGALIEALRTGHTTAAALYLLFAALFVAADIRRRGRASKHGRRRISALLLVAAILPLHSRATHAQSACTYDACALTLVPRLSGLDVVRGSNEERVSSLGFLMPRDVRGAFCGDAAAQRHAGRALSIRRVAAVLTDIGGLLAASGAVRAFATANGRKTSAAISLGGVALIGASVLPQFAADAELSRAVREYNRQFAK